MGRKLSLASTILHRFANQSVKPDAPAADFTGLFFYDGEMVALTDDDVEHSIWNVFGDMYVPVSEMFPSTTAGCAAVAKTETATNKQNLLSLDFDQTTQEHAEFSIVMPSNWLGGTLQYQAYWTAAAGSAAETVIWGLQARAYVDGDDIDQAWGTAITISDALQATGKLHKTGASSALTVAGTPQALAFVQFRIYRDVADTLAADAKLLGVHFYWGR